MCKRGRGGMSMGRKPSNYFYHRLSLTRPHSPFQHRTTRLLPPPPPPETEFCINLSLVCHPSSLVASGVGAFSFFNITGILVVLRFFLFPFPTRPSRGRFPISSHQRLYLPRPPIHTHHTRTNRNYLLYIRCTPFSHSSILLSLYLFFVVIILSANQSNHIT